MSEADCVIVPGGGGGLALTIAPPRLCIIALLGPSGELWRVTLRVRGEANGAADVIPANTSVKAAERHRILIVRG
jgi:hypothetical protein